MNISKLLPMLFRARFGTVAEVPEDLAGGLVLVADGCGGFEVCDLALRHAVGKVGLRVRVETVDWGHGFGRWYSDLTDVANFEARAAEVSARVREWASANPRKPVSLVGKSGGAWVVVRALEGLPAGSVESVVLLAAAVSPTYDLARALRAVAREMVVFWSPLDLVVLGAGTWLFGTADRVRTRSAGLVGFRRPSGPDGPKLRQVRWGWGMARSWNLGGHLGPDSPVFLRKYVVPLLAAGERPGNGARDQARATPRR